MVSRWGSWLGMLATFGLVMLGPCLARGATPAGELYVGSADTIVESFAVVGPTGNRIYGQLRRPDPLYASNEVIPAVILVPGGINPGRMEVHGQEAKLLAEAGLVVVCFNAEGRQDSMAPDDLRSEGEEDFNGFRHQAGLAAIIRYVSDLAYVDIANIGVKSQSYGITMAAGCLGRYPDLPIKYLVDGEGPPDSFVTCHGARYLNGDMQKYNAVWQIFGRLAVWQDDSPENVDWWYEREAINFIGSFRGRYLRLQATWDHAQPPENIAQIARYHRPEGWPEGSPPWWHNRHTDEIVQAAVAGGVPWVRVNLAAQGNAVNAVYGANQPPVYLPGVLSDAPWAVRAILEMVEMP